MKKIAPLGIKIIGAEHILLGGVCAFLASAHVTSLFFYPTDIFGILKRFPTFVLFSFLAFWFFSFAKLFFDLSKSIVSINNISLIFCFLLLPAYQLWLRAHAVGGGFDMFFLTVFDFIILPLALCSLAGAIYLRRPRVREILGN